MGRLIAQKGEETREQKLGWFWVCRRGCTQNLALKAAIILHLQHGRDWTDSRVEFVW